MKFDACHQRAHQVGIGHLALSGIKPGTFGLAVPTYIHTPRDRPTPLVGVDFTC